MARSVTRILLVAFYSAGALAFGGTFAATYLARPRIEAASQGYLRVQVEERARAAFGARADLLLTSTERARLLGLELKQRATALEALSASSLPDIVGRVLAELCNIDCEEEKARKATENTEAIRSRLTKAIDVAHAKADALRRFIVDEYRGRLHALIEELRIFSGLNASLFGIALVVLGTRWNDMRPLLLPAALLFASTALAAWLYLGTQDWFWSVLLGDYIGFWYLAIVGSTLAVLCDVVFNNAKISSHVVAGLPSAFLPPC